MLTRIILPIGYGQTCNQIQQVVHWIPTASRLGVPLYFPGFRRYARGFAGTANAGTPRYPRAAPPLPPALRAWAALCVGLGRTRPAWAGVLCRLIGRVRGQVAVDLATLRADESQRVHPAQVVARAVQAGGGTVWIHGTGWCVDIDRWTDCCEDVRDFFAPVPAAANRVKNLVTATRADGAILVGVHVRRGDYRRWNAGRYCYDDATYGGLLRQLRDALSPRRVRFMLVSDEPIEKGNYAGLDVATGPGDMLADLYVLASCDYLLGPPSTFTTWASVYGGVPLRHVQNPSQPLRLDEFRLIVPKKAAAVAAGVPNGAPVRC